MLSKVSIIILNWNNYEDTKECLKSLESITYPNSEIIIVDNGSTDGSIEKLNREFSQHIFIRNKENLGFSKGNNVGIKYALDNAADYVLILNNDTIVKGAKLLESLIKIAESARNIGIVAPKMLNAANHRMIDSAGHMFSSGRLIDRGYGEIDNDQYDSKVNVIGACGGAALYKKVMLQKIGLFDESFFMQYEDAELSWRAYKMGYKAQFVPQAVVYHKRGGTKVKDSKALYQSTMLNLKNTIITVRRYANPPQKLLFTIWFIYAAIKSEIRKRFRVSQVGMKPFIKALQDSLLS